ncbi:MAG: hypothetical protein LAP87_26440 [Acidobacteriia bacterium]|nr:hypothetical protein [Terriglobia bacterium]
MSPNPLNLSAQAGAAQVQGTLNFTSTGTPVTFNVAPSFSWLSVPAAPAGGWTTPVSITVTANLATLQAGNNQGAVTAVNTANGNILTIGVNVSISSIGVSPQQVGFGSYQAGTLNFPPPQTLAVSGASGALQLDRTTDDGALWFTAATLGAPAPNGILVSIDHTVAGNLSPGSYSGTLTITPTSGSNNVPVKVPVTFTVTAAPQVTVSPASLTFNWQAGGANNQTQQTLQLSATGTAAPIYATSVSGDLGASWIVAPNPALGAIPANGSQQVTVGVNGAGLLPGTYNGKVTFSLQNGVFASGQSSQDVAIKLIVSNFPLLNVPVTSLNFSYQFASGTAPAPQTVTPTSTGSPVSEVSYTVSAATADGGSWLKVPVGVLTTGNALGVSIDITNLVPQTYTGTVTITPLGNGSGQASIHIPVSLKVTNTAVLVASPAALVFPFQIGQAAPAAQRVTVGSSTGAPLNYSVAAPANLPWLQLSGQLSGTTDQTSFTVGVVTAGAVAGTLDAPLTITATDPATGATVGNPVTVDVKFYVSATPLLAVTPPGPISLTALAGGSSAPVTIALNSTSPAAGDRLTTAVTLPAQSWFSSTVPPATTGGSFTITAVPNAGLAPGVYSDNITIAATGAGGSAVADSPWTIPVRLQVNAANASVAPAALSFTQAKGAAPPVAKQLTVQSSGQTLAFSAVPNDGGVNWLSVSPTGGTTTGSFNVSVDAAKLTSGTYPGAVYVTVLNGGGSPFRIPVSFTVTQGTISAAPASLNPFTQVQGGPAPAAQTVTVSGSPGPLGFTVSTNPSGAWLSATASGAATPGTIQIAVDASTGNLAPGPYTGSVIISAPGASPSSISIPVALTVLAAQPLTATPAQLNFAYTIGLAAPPSQTVQLASTSGAAPYTVAVSSGATWLSVTPLKGNTPDTLTVAINPQSLTTAGPLTATITVTSPNSVTAATVAVNLTVSVVPPPSKLFIINAASGATGAISPGENITIFGTGVGPATLTSGVLPSGTLATTVGNTRVLFDDFAAPILYASSTQTAVFVPYEISGRATTTIRLEFLGVRSDPIVYTVVAAQPGIYTLNLQGTGPGAILNQDNSVNGSNNMAAKGSVVQVYMTGEGDTNPGGVTDAVAPSDGTGLKKPKLTPTATVGGVPATVIYAGNAPGFVNGFTQVNVRIPDNAPSGPAVPIVITFGPATAPLPFSTQSGVTVAVQ